MKKRFIRKYPYLVLLSLSFLILAVLWIEKDHLIMITKEQPEQIQDLQDQVSEAEKDVPEQPAEPEVPVNEKETELPEIEEIPVNVPEQGSETETQDPKAPVIYTADRSYFDDALFIGDSRTVGLYQYGDLGNAVILADTGMSVYKLAGKEFVLSDGSKTTFEQLLAERKFQKIYLMLGINELGYDFDQTARKYAGIVDKIMELQPQAILFVQANLHITSSKSAKSDIYNNENINRLNDSMKAIAEERNLMYLDVNPLFDDGEGNLSPEYTVDESHVLGKYYKDWVDWLLSNAVEIPSEN